MKGLRTELGEFINASFWGEASQPHKSLEKCTHAAYGVRRRSVYAGVEGRYVVGEAVLEVDPLLQAEGY